MGDTLTQVERELLQCLAQGMTVTAAANVLHYSERTLYHRVGEIKYKLQAPTLTRAVVVFVEGGR